MIIIRLVYHLRVTQGRTQYHTTINTMEKKNRKSLVWDGLIMAQGCMNLPWEDLWYKMLSQRNSLISLHINTRQTILLNTLILMETVSFYQMHFCRIRT